MLIHYGSYETNFLKQMKQRHGSAKPESVATETIAAARLVAAERILNLQSQVKQLSGLLPTYLTL